jgi:hypothetical protein
MTPDRTIAKDSGETMDARLVVLTDLGIVAKKTLDGSREVFVQSLAGGTAVAGARVRVLARNGETLAAADTDCDGPRLAAAAGWLRPREATRWLIVRHLRATTCPSCRSTATTARSICRASTSAATPTRSMPARSRRICSRTAGCTARATRSTSASSCAPADWNAAAGGHSAGSGVLRSARQRGQARSRVALDATGFDGFTHTPPTARPRHLAGDAVPDRRGGLAHHDRQPPRCRSASSCRTRCACAPPCPPRPARAGSSRMA